MTSPTTGRVDAPILTFLGAAGTVTGSRFLVEVDGRRVLVDAGLYQGPKALRLRNWAPFPVDPATIDAVVLTHAHVDHCGYLPLLARDGFGGPVIATQATVALARIVLPDSGHLHEEEARFANRTGYSKHRPALPLYTEADARAMLPQFHAVGFGARVEVAPGIQATLQPAGHILGSSIVDLELDGRRRRRLVRFSGDLGRPSHPLLVAPASGGAPDILLVESTYGDRRHDDADALDRFATAIATTAARGGVVLIPAFAVDRTEVLLHHLRRLRADGRIPDLPTYVDSPMALAALDVYRDAVRRRSPEIRPEVLDDPDPFGAADVRLVHEVEDSMALDRLHGPAIIISASGMATGGRVLHHLERYLPDHRTTVVLAGFQAPQTRGRRLADGAKELKLLGRYVPVHADVVDLPAFSVHADADELLAWLGATDRLPETTYVVHGEPSASSALQEAIEAKLGGIAVVPSHGERVRLD